MNKSKGIITNKPLAAKYSLLPEPQNSEVILPVTAAAKARDKAILAKRTTKNSQKLKLFPEGEDSREKEEEITDVNLPHVVKVTQSKKEDWLLNKLERKWLPRVTGYCTANSYKMDSLHEDLKKRGLLNNTAPKRFDEVIYTTFTWDTPSASSGLANFANMTSPVEQTEFLFQNIDSSGQEIPQNYPLNLLAKRIAPYAEVLFFEYGVVVMWGFTAEEEGRMLDYLKLFEEQSLQEEDVQTEEFHYHYHANCQPRIFNDVITLKNPSNFMIKLTISHSVAQSCKLALFEGLMDQTIENTRNVPQIMAEQGTIRMSRHAINKKIGTLFIMRINVNLVSNVLDTPEIFWSEPALEPLYVAIRGYLEISQRVDLLNKRVGVISDLLDMLKEHLNSSHGEQLEWIVIILIAFEIVIGIITIAFDLTTYLQHPNSKLM